MKPAISFRDVSFSYSDHLVLDRVSFEINEGEAVSIVGPNGGGKTTILKLILGLIRPKTGYLEVLQARPSVVRHRIGYMPQHDRLDPLFPITALEVVLMGRLGYRSKLPGFFSRRDNEIASRALEQMGLVHVAQRLLSRLSGGQRQRVLIARAIASEPDIMLLDEPTAHADLLVESEFMDTLSRLGENMTIVTVSHDLGFVSGSVKKVICLNRTARTHPTSALNEEVMRELYGEDLRVVRHRHAIGGDTSLHRHG